jgi:hypothetical protein
MLSGFRASEDSVTCFLRLITRSQRALSRAVRYCASSFERIDGYDRFIELIERIVICWKSHYASSGSQRCQAYQRDRESCLDFFLKPGEHRLGGNNQNPVGSLAQH